MVGLGRYIPRVARVNAEVDINIVAATGLYTFDEIPHFLHYRGPGTLLGGDEPMTEMFVKDIREGIGGTGDQGRVPQGRRRGAGAHPRTRRGCSGPSRPPTSRPACRSPCTPTPRTRPAGSRWTSTSAEGVDLTKVVVGHAGDSNDLDYLRALADRGATIGCDRFGLDRFNPTEQRVATIAALCAQGYADRIVLAHDASCYIDFFSARTAQDALAQAAPNWHYEHISRDVLPALREPGVTDEQITTMMVDNPRRYFGG